MISLGSSTWGSSPTIDVGFRYEKQRSGADMQYRAEITIGDVTGARYFGYPIYLGLYINGALVLTQTLKNASPSQWGDDIVFTSSWYTVQNKTDGTTPVTFRIYSGSGSSRDQSYSYAMGVDPAGSTITAANGTLGTAQTIGLTRYSNAFTDTLTWSCGSASGTIATKSALTSFSWTPDISLAAQDPNSAAVIVTLSCSTYDGDTLIQTRTFTVSEAVPSSVKPSVSLSVSDDEGYAATYGAYVQGQSALAISVTPTLAYGSDIASYAIAADGMGYTSTPVVTPPLSGSGAMNVTAAATDRRGRTSDTATQAITVLPWAAPVISNLTCERCLQDGTPNSEGAYMLITFDAEVADLNNQNSAAYVLQYKKQSDQNWTSQTLTTYENQYSVSGGTAVVAADISYGYDAQLVVSDDFTAVTVPAPSIGIAFDLIDYYNTGKGVTFGRVATSNDFVCAMDAYFEKNVNIAQDLTLTGDANISGDASIGGDASVTGDLTVGGAVSLTTPLGISSGGTGSATWEDISNDFTFSKTSGSSTISSFSAYRWGKVVEIYINLTTTASVSAGSTMWFGLMSGGHAPLVNATGFTYIGSSGAYITAARLATTGNIRVHQLVGNVASGSSVAICITYIEA